MSSFKRARSLTFGVGYKTFNIKDSFASLEDQVNAGTFSSVNGGIFVVFGTIHVKAEDLLMAGEKRKIQKRKSKAEKIQIKVQICTTRKCKHSR